MAVVQVVARAVEAMLEARSACLSSLMAIETRSWLSCSLIYILEQFGLLQGCVSIRTPEALANLVSRRVPEVIIISGRHEGEGSL